MTRNTLSVLVALFVSLAGLGHAEAQDGSSLAAEAAAAPEAEVVHRADRGLVIAGSVVLSLGWGLNTLGAFAGEAGLAYNDDEGADLWETRYALSLVPVVGRVIWGSWALAIDDGRNVALALFAFGDALVQGAGLAMLIAGLIGHDEPVGEIAEGVRVTPVVSSAGSGVMVDARF